MAAAELADGDGAMLDSIGAEAGAEELGAAVVDPPQAVRLSMAAAAIPATERVVRLMFCISVSPLLCRSLPRRTVAALALFRLVGTDPWLVSQWVFGGSGETDGCGMEILFIGSFYAGISGRLAAELGPLLGDVSPDWPGFAEVPAAVGTGAALQAARTGPVRRERAVKQKKSPGPKTGTLS
jgi:hypothetical protein